MPINYQRRQGETGGLVCGLTFLAHSFFITEAKNPRRDLATMVPTLASARPAQIGAPPFISEPGPFKS